MSLQAVDLGLMVHQIGGFNKETLRQKFQLPDEYIPLAVMAIGYESIEEDPQSKPRTRRPIGDNFFLGEWGNGLDY